MPFLIIVIGKPGSGKSTFIQLLSSKFRTYTDYQIQIFNDREILLEISHESDSRELIRPLGSGNFEIVNVVIYDIAIEKLISRLRKVKDNKILLVEFSRKDYVKTFERFGDFFSGSCSLAIYLDTPFNTCKERNIERAISNHSYSVPSNEMDSYFQVDDMGKLILVYPKRVIVLNNESEVADLAQQLEEIWPILQKTISQRKD